MRRAALLLVVLVLLAGGAAIWFLSDPATVDAPAGPAPSAPVERPSADRRTETAEREPPPQAEPERAAGAPRGERSTIAEDAPKSAWIKGNVFSGSTKGLGGATVRATLRLGAETETIATGVSDDDGTYALETRALVGLDEILPGPEVWVHFGAPGHQDASQRALRDPRAPATWQTSARLVPGACLVGRVVDASGAPVADAEVNCELAVEVPGLGVQTPRRGAKPARTDPDGRYRLGVPTARVTKVFARKIGAGYAERVIDVSVESEDVAVDDLALATLERMAGRVVYPDGSPARGLTLLAQQVGGAVPARPGDLARASPVVAPPQAWSSRARTKDDGSFAFDDLRPGQYTIVEQDVDVLGAPQRGGVTRTQTWARAQGGLPIETGRNDLVLETQAVRFALEIVRADGSTGSGAAWVALVPQDRLEATLTRLPPPTGSVVRLGQRAWFRSSPDAAVAVLAWESGKGRTREAIATRELRRAQPGEELVRIELPAEAE